ncbi:MAG: TlyA family rRNA (cytidine-2'-O)-methyltransferase [Deltaproteobacteria bacterium]
MSDPSGTGRSASRPGSSFRRRGKEAGGTIRLDAALVDRGLAASRSKAQGLILAGRVRVGGILVTKCGATVSSGEPIELVPAPRPYVSRGGGKLAGALDDLGVRVAGAVALDVGASTGGFTDCLLRRGALRVYAVDVGRGLLDAALRADPRVVVLEGVNFRYAPSDLLPERAGVAVVDVSFISLRHILPPLASFLDPGAEVVALVKPQFEAGRESVGKGGVVRDEAARRRAVDSVIRFAREAGYLPLGEAESRIRGPKGNREVFLHLRRMPEKDP